MVLESDRLAIQAAVKTSNLLDKTQIKMARIKNTLLLDEMEISENLTSQAEAMKPYVEVASGPYEFPVRRHGKPILSKTLKTVV